MKYTLKSTLFASLDSDAQNILNSFDSVIRNVQPLSEKQLRMLPANIRKLSHELTDERSKRRNGYMNDTVHLSAYVHYFMWWNLVRLTSVFAGLPKTAFDFLDDDCYCLDLGSGPLTVPIALYLARPELRKKKLSWYCVDLSHNALCLGENILLSITAQLKGTEWNIIRIKDQPGVNLKHKAAFVSCANMFNELYWDSDRTPEEIVKKYGTMLLSYTDKQSLIFVAEPGIPRAARFISLLRDFLLRKKAAVISPCTHETTCPMDGRKGKKWCHFVLDGKHAPKALQKLSLSAGLPKDRATISFVCAKQGEYSEKNKNIVRIISDPIFISRGVNTHKERCRYACASWGLTLAKEYKKGFTCGDEVEYSITHEQIIDLPIDKKTSAKII
ncbi:MAG: small ribosomal subunit Rsm22 family protein [Spirochaetales bacterium]